MPGRTQYFFPPLRVGGSGQAGGNPNHRVRFLLFCCSPLAVLDSFPWKSCVMTLTGGQQRDAIPGCCKTRSKHILVTAKRVDRALACLLFSLPPRGASSTPTSHRVRVCEWLPHPRRGACYCNVRTAIGKTPQRQRQHTWRCPFSLPVRSAAPTHTLTPPERWLPSPYGITSMKLRGSLGSVTGRA